MRYFMRLSYRGAPFHGWQRQPGAVSVQETLEEALSTVMRRPVAIIGAGRTDTGVNARMMVAHFDSALPIADEERFLASLNGMTDPKHICFYSLVQVADDAHARFDATARTYRYYVHTRRSPFLFPYSLQLPPGIDFEAMNRACRLLLATEDFTSFAKLHGQTKTNICNVTAAAWHKMPVEGDRYYFEITANRFLRNMVRSVTGTLLEIGRGKLTEEGLQTIIDARDRSAAGTSLPPSPLFLHRIVYPYF